MPIHLASVNEIAVPYGHIYISPHLDDAALSCGGAIARHIANNQRVLVVTICTAAPPADAAFSPFVTQMHAAWGLEPHEAVTARLQEDIAALECLGADGLWLGLEDAIYRLPTVYTSNETLFAAVAPGDPLGGELSARLDELVQRCPEAMFYAPLGVGQHVDHQVAYAAAMELSRTGIAVAFYEDFPYVAAPGALEQRLAQLGGSGAFVPSVLNIDATLARKISSIEAYASQIDHVFGDIQQMTRQVTMYAEELRPDIGTYGERLWLRRV